MVMKDATPLTLFLLLHIHLVFVVLSFRYYARQIVHKIAKTNNNCFYRAGAYIMSD